MIALLQRLLDRLLADQTEAQQRLARHAGRRVQIDVLGASATLAIDAGGTLRIVGLRGDPDADLRVRISTASLAALPGGDPLRGASIEGAADLADDFSAAARMLRFDPADWLASVTGDILANRIGDGLRAMAAAAADALARSDALLREAASGDALPLPSRATAGAFDGDLRRLFDAAEALGRRIDRLEDSAAR